MLLIGRSGTGKTSIAIARMWALYAARIRATENLSPEEKDAPVHAYNQIFVTANAVLRDQARALSMHASHARMHMCVMRLSVRCTLCVSGIAFPDY